MLKNFNGISVIGDIHGTYDKFKLLVDKAKEQNYFIISLGDICDYGDTIDKCLDLACEITETKIGYFIRSNHDSRLYRYLKGNKTNMPDGFKKTVSILNDSLSTRFSKCYSKAKPWLKYENYLFVHAAFHPLMLEIDHYTHPFLDKKISSYLRKQAYYGETDGTTNSEGFPNRTYNWVKTIPSHIHVVCGHSIRSLEKPLFDGNAIFLDTGCGKEGKLSAMNINFAMSNYATFITV